MRSRTVTAVVSALEGDANQTQVIDTSLMVDLADLFKEAVELRALVVKDYLRVADRGQMKDEAGGLRA
jgi:hypothetical protein